MISQRSGSVSESGALSISRSALPIAPRAGAVDITRSGAATVARLTAARRATERREEASIVFARVKKRTQQLFGDASAVRRRSQIALELVPGAPPHMF